MSPLGSLLLVICNDAKTIKHLPVDWQILLSSGSYMEQRTQILNKPYLVRYEVWAMQIQPDLYQQGELRKQPAWQSVGHNIQLYTASFYEFASF